MFGMHQEISISSKTINAAVIDCHSTCIILSKNVKQKFVCLQINLTLYYSIKLEWDCDK